MSDLAKIAIVSYTSDLPQNDLGTCSGLYIFLALPEPIP